VRRHADVADVAVVGVPHDRLGEEVPAAYRATKSAHGRRDGHGHASQVVAFVIAKGGAAVEGLGDRIRAWCVPRDHASRSCVRTTCHVVCRPPRRTCMLRTQSRERCLGSIRKRVHGAEHPNTLLTAGNLGGVLACAMANTLMPSE
jgi:hypothetical protein